MIAETRTLRAFDPAIGQEIEPPFAVTNACDVAQVCVAADAVFDTFRETAPADRARLLEAIAERIEGLGDALVARAAQESGLPPTRLIGERGRTAFQLRLFADTVRRGDWARVTLDTPLPDRTPLPRPDLRQRRIPLGPVAVFGASNFPLAFSVAGGDTAAALAAGCPVVAKAHPAHPGTSQMVAEAISAAIADSGLPEGIFALVQGAGNDVGAALVGDPRIKAVGFTGSRSGGLALVAIANARPVPIPVFAEMSSVNPVLLLPAALAARGEALARGYVASLTLGAGQFCTNPGLLVAVDGPDLDAFAAAAADALGAVGPQVMLTPGIHAAYESGVAALDRHGEVQPIGRGKEGSGCTLGRAALFSTDAVSFLDDPALGDEVFGASSLLVRCVDLDEVRRVVGSLEGQLTATLQLDPADHEIARGLLPLLERRAGRILCNGWPTGVEVSTAMVHGGPFPATSDGRTTSVGTAAIERFLRPVCYQDLPEAILPSAVADANRYGLPRTIDGVRGGIERTEN